MGRISSQKRKNYIINGDMQISQRGASFAAIASGAYCLDRWSYSKSGAMVHTASQSSDGPTDTQSGYQYLNSLNLNLTTPDTSIAAGDYCFLEQRIEGYNFSQFARRKTFTVSFWVKATTTGIYCVYVKNSGADRSYVAEYTINSSNTWEYKTITILSPTPSTGTWDYTNGIGLRVGFTVAAGTTYQTTAGSWQTGNFLATSNQVNGVNTGATDFRITGVMLNEGFNAQPFRTYGEGFNEEYAACKRYYEIGSNTLRFQNIDTAGRNSFAFVFFSTEKRINPTTANNNTGQTNVGSVTVAGANTKHISFVWAGNGSGIDFQNTCNWTADAEL